MHEDAKSIFSVQVHSITKTRKHLLEVNLCTAFHLAMIGSCQIVV